MGTPPPPVDRQIDGQTRVKTLPSLVLRTWAVITIEEKLYRLMLLRLCKEPWQVAVVYQTRKGGMQNQKTNA